MDRAVWQEHLAQTELHIVEAEKRVARQREIVAELERDGHRVTAARGLLAAFERLLAMYLADRQSLQRDFEEAIAEKPAGRFMIRRHPEGDW
jgi:hypothetical protein